MCEPLDIERFLPVLLYSMDKEELVLLKHMSDTLDKILAVMLKPQSIVVQIFNIGATVVTILGILTIADLIKSWIGG